MPQNQLDKILEQSLLGRPVEESHVTCSATRFIHAIIPSNIRNSSIVFFSSCAMMLCVVVAVTRTSLIEQSSKMPVK